MVGKLSSGNRMKISASLEREEEQKKAQKKQMEERELCKLKMQSRMMKDAKLKDGVVEKNKKVKLILEKEKDSLEKNLKLMKSNRRCILDSKQAQDIANLFAQGDDLDAAIAQEKKYIEDLESQIHRDIKNIHAVKKEKGENVICVSDYLHQREKERADRSLEAWKSKLAAEQTQLALVTKENEVMRMKVERLIKVKGQFNKLFGDLMGKLTKGKAVMADVVERSRQQFQKRDEVHRKIGALKSRDRADLAKQMEEMQELELRLYEDKKLSAFRARVQVMREKLEDNMRESHKATVTHQELLSRLEKVNDLWSQIQGATGQTVCEEVCRYIVAEETNLFTLHVFNNEIYDQVEVLTHKTTELMGKVDEESIAAEDLVVANTKKRNIIEGTLHKMEHCLSDERDLLDANSRLFDRLLDKVKGLFDLMKCNLSQLNDLLGENTKVTEHNYRLFLNLVEGEVIYLLDTFNSTINPATSRSDKSFVQRSKSKIENRSRSTFPNTKKVITRPCVECDKKK